MLGRDLVEVLSEGQELYLLDVERFPPSLSSQFSTLTLDITDSARTYREVTKIDSIPSYSTSAQILSLMGRRASHI